MKLSKSKLIEMIKNDVGVFEKTNWPEEYSYTINYSAFIKVIIYYSTKRQNFDVYQSLKIEKYFIFTEEYYLSDVVGHGTDFDYIINFMKRKKNDLWRNHLQEIEDKRKQKVLKHWKE